MERLTKISEIGNAYYPKCFEEPCCGMGECLDDKCSLMLDACKKLAEYELAQRDFPAYQRKMLAKQRLGK